MPHRKSGNHFFKRLFLFNGFEYFAFSMHVPWVSAWCLCGHRSTTRPWKSVLVFSPDSLQLVIKSLIQHMHNSSSYPRVPTTASSFPVIASLHLVTAVIISLLATTLLQWCLLYLAPSRFWLPFPTMLDFLQTFESIYTNTKFKLSGTCVCNFTPPLQKPT